MRTATRHEEDEGKERRGNKGEDKENGVEACWCQGQRLKKSQQSTMMSNGDEENNGEDGNKAWGWRGQ